MKLLPVFRSLILSALALLATGCGVYETKTQASSLPELSSLVQNANAKISYAQIQHYVLDPNCMRCHSDAVARGGVALANYAEVSAQVAAMKADIDSGDMPLQGSMSEDQIKLFDKWVAQGHPELGNGEILPLSTPSPTPVSTSSPAPNATITFADVNRVVFQPSCIDCHGAQSPRAGIELIDFAHVKSLISMITSDIDDGSMPLNGVLTPEQKNLYGEWIAQGATELGQTPGVSTTPSPTPVPTATPIAPSETLAISTIRNQFDLSVKPLVQRACMDCHDSHAVPSGLGRLPIVRRSEWRHIEEASKILDFSLTFPNWSTQSSNAISFLTQIRGAIVSKTMPPSYFRLAHALDHKILSKAETQVILDWVNQSLALLQSTQSSPPTATEFLKNNCMGCHNATISSGGLSLVNAAGDIQVPTGNASNGTPYLTHGDPLHSAIYEVLLGDTPSRHGLPKMPLGATASASDQKLIFDWIMTP
jgi:mono/diheme cytochrome c family protein